MSLMLLRFNRLMIAATGESIAYERFEVWMGVALSMQGAAQMLVIDANSDQFANDGWQYWLCMISGSLIASLSFIFKAKYFFNFIFISPQNM